jgi:hypothetical protein
MGGKTYYAFKASKQDVKFIALESDYPSPEQREWLQQELSGGEDWMIPFFHHPLYSSGMHGSHVDLRKAMEPMLLESNVTVVFTGHDHFYERILPQHGITHFVVGSGGKLRRGDINKNSGLTAKGFDTDRAFSRGRDRQGRTLLQRHQPQRQRDRFRLHPAPPQASTLIHAGEGSRERNDAAVAAACRGAVMIRERPHRGGGSLRTRHASQWRLTPGGAGGGPPPQRGSPGRSAATRFFRADHLRMDRAIDRRHLDFESADAFVARRRFDLPCHQRDAE